VPRTATAGVIALLGLLQLCPAALGDADPASDVLLGENVFYPYSPAVSARFQARLDAEVKAAHRARLPLKVALIDTPVDLGALPTLFGKPRQYAAFLDQEITFGRAKVPLLVVMPQGYGSAGLPVAASAAVASLPRPISRTSDGLARAASSAVRRIAAAAGHPLGRTRAGSAPGGGGSGSTVVLVIVVGVCVVLAAGILAVRRRRAVGPARARRS
jgi:hypothetical protein